MPRFLPARGSVADGFSASPASSGFPLAGLVAWRSIREWAVHPLPAYASIILLQLKVVWGMWWFRDLTAGDTAGYFASGAHLWYLRGELDLVWSPLYAMYYGSFLYLTPDAYVATIGHRLALVLVVAGLVLALMRRLLEPRIAWLAAAWWVVQPVNHDVLYEVHLFAVLPVLVAAVVLFGRGELWRHGVAVATLLGGALLVRNELVVPTALLAATALRFGALATPEARTDHRPWLARRLLAFGVPALVVVAMPVVLYYGSSRYDVSETLRRFREKHTLNVCQIYAYGYQQRHPDWRKSPWVECHELMRATFGTAQPSMAEAFRLNPRAMLGHVGWNAGLIPSGLQVLLFNATSGTVQPGYELVEKRSTSALVLSLALGVLYVSGAAVMAGDRTYWWSVWLRPRIWGWLLLTFASAGCVVVMVTQRPRPAYLFTLELALQAAAGLCLQALLRRWRLGERLAAAFPLVVILLLAAVPSYYAGQAPPPPRTLLDGYRTLAPVRAMIQKPGTLIVTPGYGSELCAYLRNGTARPCRSLDYYELRGLAPASSAWWRLLDARGATLFYANEAVTGDPAMRAVLADAEAAGWEVVMRQATGRDERLLLRRVRFDQAPDATGRLELWPWRGI